MKRFSFERGLFEVFEDVKKAVEAVESRARRKGKRNQRISSKRRQWTYRTSGGLLTAKIACGKPCRKPRGETSGYIRFDADLENGTRARFKARSDIGQLNNIGRPRKRAPAALTGLLRDRVGGYPLVE